MVEYFEAARTANSFPDLERVVQDALGRSGFMLFAEFDFGAVLRRESGLEAPNSMRFLVGNPLIMKEMVKHVPAAGSYAPVTVLIDERPDGVHLSMTEWRAICCRMAARKRLPSHAISMRKSQPCFAQCAS
jgi:uncharacterized protein (DUF302 family)